MAASKNRRGGHRAPSRHDTERNVPSTPERSASVSLEPPQAGSSQIIMEPENDSRRNSNVRGVTCGKGARKAMRSAKERLRIAFDFKMKQAICNNTEALNNEIGHILRNNCSLQYKEWRLVPPNVRAPLREKLLALFDIDITDERVQEIIDAQMQKAWRSHRYILHKYFKKIGGEDDPATAKSTTPSSKYEVTKEDWEYLCDYWTDDKYKERAKNNANARSKRPWETRNGSKSTARHHVCRGADLEAPTGQIETWRIRHLNSEKGWPSPELEAKYEEMMQLRRDNSVENMTDKMILEKVLGRQSNRLFGWGRSPSKSRKTSSGSSSRPTYNEAIDELIHVKAEHQSLKDEFLRMRQQLIDHKILPDSTSSHAPLVHRSSPFHGDASPAGEHDDYSQHNLDDIVMLSENDADTLDLDKKFEKNKKKRHDKRTMNASMPMPLHLVYLHCKELEESKDTIRLQLDNDVFGHERTLYIGLEDVDPFYKLRPISYNCVAVYIWCLYKKMRSSELLKKFKFVDPARVGHIPCTKKDKKIIPQGIEKRARALYIGLKGTRTNQMVLVPCNVGEHWILTVIDPHNEEVALLDSLYHGNHDVSWKQVIEMALKMFNVDMKRDGKKTASWTIIQGAKQPDCYQCGFYVMRYMKEIVSLGSCENIGSIKSLERSKDDKEDKKRYSEDEINEVRKEWAKCLLHSLQV